MKKLFLKIKRFFKWLFFADHQTRLGRIPISLKGMKWEMHITDVDSNPSVPHLHCVENSKLKINIYNGEVYDDGINLGKLKDKEFNALWHDKKFLQMVNKARDYYAKNFPNYELEEIPISLDKIDENVIVSMDKNTNTMMITYVKRGK